MHTNTSPADAVWNRVLGACMFLAPIVLLLSSVIFWTAGEHWGGTVRVYAFFLFIPAVLGLTQLLWERAPRAAVILRCLLLFGSAGGVGWGAADALYGAADDKGFDAATLDELHGIIETGLPLALNLPGITFPLAMVFTGIALWRTRAVPAPAAILLAIAGVGFPASRIPAIDPLMCAVDVLFIVALGWIGTRLLNPNEAATRTAHPATAPAA